MSRAASVQSFSARWFLRRKEARMGTASGRTGLRSIFSGEPAISVRAAGDTTSADSSGTTFCRDQWRRSTLPFTVVSLVISFFRRSKKINNVPGSSAGSWSPTHPERKVRCEPGGQTGSRPHVTVRQWLPRLQMIWPMQEMARSLTSWSMSAAFKRLIVQVKRSLM